MFYSLLGVVQYTIWEGIILHCYATGRLPYLTNKEVVSLSNLLDWNVFFFGLLRWPLTPGTSSSLFSPSLLFHFSEGFTSTFLTGWFKFVTQQNCQILPQLAPLSKTCQRLFQPYDHPLGYLKPGFDLRQLSLKMRSSYLLLRFIHIRALYKHIHAVHHRNTDIEPFAGLSMHPIEVGFRNTMHSKIAKVQCDFPL